MILVNRNPHPCRVFRLGTIGYEEAFRLQNRLAQARFQEQVEDTLLLLQHPPVITIGRSGKAQNVLVPERILQERNIQVIYTDRGGDVTYHGPGQLVAYPILNLRLHGLSVPGFVWNLEEVAIRLLAGFNISSGRMEKLRGVWAGKEKICSLGVHLSHWVSKHGLALNVNTDLDAFRFINPCGITDCQVTSMARILGRPLSLEEIETSFLKAFAQVFGFALCEEPLQGLEPYR